MLNSKTEKIIEIKTDTITATTDGSAVLRVTFPSDRNIISWSCDQWIARQVYESNKKALTAVVCNWQGTALTGQKVVTTYNYF